MSHPNRAVIARRVCVLIDTICVSRHRILHHHHASPTVLRPFGAHHGPVCGFLGAPGGGQQVDEEGEDVKGEDEGDDPFEDGANVLAAGEGRTDEDGGEGDLDEDEGELEPKGEAQDAVLAEVHAEALVLGADEDGTDDIPGHEEEKETVVQARVV